MTHRAEFINFFLRKTKGTNYLEIGVDDARRCYKHINCENKIGVDPKWDATHDESVINETSDQFFANTFSNLDLDVAFIDGLHHWEQVVKDVKNTIDHINGFGVVMLHDCLPVSEQMQERIQCEGAWTGDTWKAVEFLNRYATGLDNRFTIPEDWGCHVIVVDKNNYFVNVPIPNEAQLAEINALDYKWYLNNVQSMSIFITPNELEQHFTL